MRRLACRFGSQPRSLPLRHAEAFLNAVFADTAFFAAIVNRNDEYHLRAKQVAARVGDAIITTEYVLLETANFCTRGYQREAFVRLIARLRDASAVEIVASSASLFQQGLDLFASRLDKEWSLTDCISFAVMNERRLADALTTDRHFEQAGFTALLAD